MTFRRSIKGFSIISESNNHYNAKTTEANMYVRKLTVAGHTLTAIEKTLLTTPEVYSYTEVARKHSCNDRYEKLKTITNQAYLGTNKTTPYQFQVIGPSQVVIYRNGNPVVSTPISTTHKKCLYFNALLALDFLDKIGYRIAVSKYSNRFTMNFDPISTQEIS